MKYSQDLAQLVIANIENHERAKKVLAEVNGVLLGRISLEVKDILTQFPNPLDLDCDFDLYENGCIDFSFTPWLVQDERSVNFSVQPSEENDDEWVSHLCGLNGSSNYLALHFYTDYRMLGLKALQFKVRLKEALFEKTSLIEQGFKLSADGYSVEYVIKFNHTDIVEGYPHDLEKAMLPLVAAMDALKSAMPEFDKLQKILINHTS
ncbi:hypothetical protein [Photobacterium sanguinicancri]|uniref:hypothetical protein n=1 Tax=Photobacterium sanguinicancri TaxID=875932 RepID=UPI003D133C93